ncbi:glycosyltransferase N-terminal domain-containing protein [Halocella sp. SP3-1]|uniref:glycosyltransferase N-terminal domain-containing protein n=1 Tax=Halocella sp. SP3-1 TaxID=2382161 RepID=UPI002570D9D5|nr:glycosyltransferase N-terminal domain-containing protein [Halocella sp. SP3-1]
MYIIYNIIIFLAFILYLPVLLFKFIRGKYREGFLERLGFLPSELINKTWGDRVIWLHAASMGETIAAGVLIKRIREEYPAATLLVSTISNTGRSMAAKNEMIDGVFYFPLDIAWIAGKVIEKINPALIIMMETELWPNLIKKASKAGCKLMLASGRISDSSIKNYRYIKPLIRDVLKKIDIFSMQSSIDYERIISLGAPEERVYCTGNIKFDRFDGLNLDVNHDELLKEFKLDNLGPIIVAGSTHEGEEEKLLTVFKEVKKEYPDAVLMIAPRYIERAEQLLKDFKERGFNTVLRTRIVNYDPGRDSIILVDTIGELVKLYSLADLVFVGGSLIPRGGHNILEPAALGKPVFFGPHMFNFAADTRDILAAGAGVQVNDEKELAAEILTYLSDRDKLCKMGQQGREIINQNRGAVDKNLEFLNRLLPEKKTEKILIVRLSAIGDVIHSLPVAYALRKAYPDAEISWLVEEKASELVLANPYLDQVFVMPKREWLAVFKKNKIQALKMFRSFFKKVKSRDFDLVLDIHGLFKSGLSTYLGASSLRYGPADGREGSTLFYNRKIKVPEQKMHVIEKRLALAAAVGAETDEVEFGIVSSRADRERVSSLLQACGSKRIIALNPYTTWESKNWPPEYFARLADLIKNKLNYVVVFTGGSGDREGIAGIINLMQIEALNLAGKTNLRELAELYRRVELFIGGDTGPMHLAAAVGTRVIALMGPTDPVTHGPYGEGHLIIQDDIDCKLCWKRSCPAGHNKCMKNIGVDRVFNKTCEILGVERYESGNQC